MADERIRYVLSAVDETRGAFRSLETGLTRIRDQAAVVATRFTAIGGALSVLGAGAAFKNAVDELAALDDAAESTGASVESLSSLLNTLAPTGVTLDQISDAAGKLARSMKGAADETKGAGEAFKALGIEIRDASGNFRAVDDVLTEIATSLARYEDGPNKVAIAQAIFGKSGAGLLPMLKDLATRQREAGTVTGEQAAQAERLANAWRTLDTEATKLRQAIASEVIPGLADLIEQFNAVGRAGGSMWERIRGALGPNKAMKDLESDLAGLTAQRETAARLGLSDDALADYDRRIEEVRAKIQRLTGALRIANGPTLKESIFGDVGYGGGALGNAPAIGRDGDAAKAARDAAQAYRDFDAFIRQAEIDSQLNENAAAAKAFADATRDLVAELETFEAVEMSTRGAPLAADVAGWQKVADLLREIRGIDAASKTRDAALDSANQLLNSGAITFDEYEKLSAKILGVTEPAKDGITELTGAARDLGLTFQSAFEDAIVGGEKFSKVLQSLGQDILRILVRKTITEPIIGGLLGDGKTGGLLSPLLAAIGIGKRAAGGPVGAGLPYLVGERGPELIVPRSAGTVIPNHALGGGQTVVHNHYHIDSRTDRSVIVADIQRAQLASLGAQRDARARGNEAFA